MDMIAPRQGNETDLDDVLLALPDRSRRPSNIALGAQVQLLLLPIAGLPWRNLSVPFDEHLEDGRA